MKIFDFHGCWLPVAGCRYSMKNQGVFDTHDFSWKLGGVERL